MFCGVHNSATASVPANKSPGGEQMEEYDPDRDMAADEWLDLDEQERMILVEDYHRRHRVRMPSVEGHAAIHAIVENQLALEEPAVVATFARLRLEGLDRHDAVHAVGSVLASHMHALLVGEQSPTEQNERYYQALGKLSAHNWRAG
jgi:hypothetical protein